MIRHGVQVLICPTEGAPFRDVGEVLDAVGDASYQGAELVVMPAGRLPDGFFRLRTGIAGEILQKFANYRLRLVVLGDIADHVAGSTALRDLVRESNRGDQVWFVADLAELDERLARSGTR